MIEKLKSTLLEIRKERDLDHDLRRYKDSERYATRKAVLTLELPFETDSVSVLNARASAYQKRNIPRSDLLNITSEEEILPEKVPVRMLKDGQELFSEEKINVKKSIKNGSETPHNFIEKWIDSGNSTSTKNVRRTVYYILKKWIVKLNNRLPKDQKLSAEELPHILTLETMEKIINEEDVDHTTKKVYLSQARNLNHFMMKAYPISPVLKGRRGRLSLNDAAKLFEFLETRALKSTTIRAYHDILLCRALFYAPLPEKEFFSLGPPTVASSCLCSGKDVFCVPRSFIKLWKEFSYTDCLLGRIFDNRQLHKKIQRLGKYAELKIESLTPSIMRSSAKAIYFTDLLLSDDVIALLPKRI